MLKGQTGNKFKTKGEKINLLKMVIKSWESFWLRFRLKHFYTGYSRKNLQIECEMKATAVSLKTIWRKIRKTIKMFTSLGIIKFGFHITTSCFWIGWQGDACHNCAFRQASPSDSHTFSVANSVPSRSHGDLFGIWRVNLAWAESLIWLAFKRPSSLCRQKMQSHSFERLHFAVFFDGLHRKTHLLPHGRG